MKHGTGRIRWWWALLAGLVAIGADPSANQEPPRAEAPWSPPESLRDPRLEPLRRASTAWELRPGPEREVVDQVCLVPDVATFLEAISAWDRDHWFPILFDDVESTFRFLRAFKPARVIRYPKASPAIPEGQLWAKAVASVGASWRVDSRRSASSPRPSGDVAPEGMGPTPPGIVLSSPDAAMLPGAVALAAGRFQPLVRLASSHRFADVLTIEQARTFARRLETAIAAPIHDYRRLGDACDFVTLAGDWPYRYRGEDGEVDAIDDLVGRSTVTGERWAFAGRLLGDAKASVYRAMCSLFLLPDSALMFNGYDEEAQPWATYETRLAATRFAGVVPTSQVSGPTRATIQGWHKAFGDENPHGLLLVNSHGSPTVFNIQGGPASAADIPRGVPAAVAMIHSFSAADPADPDTVAGRWLANGAFVFYGSVNEPFLAAFRTPRLVGDLLGEGVPMAAAVRETLEEPYGKPWRLIYLGDPLYRVQVHVGGESRSKRWGATAGWPRYAEAPRPASGPDEALLQWALQAALARSQTTDTPPPQAPGDLADVVAGLRRDLLPARVRPVYDALLAEVLLAAGRRGDLLSRLARIPDAERTPDLRRLRETLLARELDGAIARNDAARTMATWRDVIASDASRDFKAQATTRAGKLADTAARLQEWAGLLRITLNVRPKAPESEAVAAELKRVEEAIRADRGRP